MILRAEAVDVRMGARTLVKGLDLEIETGQRWGVLGCNGAGKSTLLHVLAGLRKPDAGQVFVNDTPMAQVPRRALARAVGVLLQEETRDYWGSTRDYVMLGRYPHQHWMFGPAPRDREIVDRALESMDLGGLEERAYRSLSGGERQRARLAALSSQQAACYLCDEPLQQLDLRHQVAFLNWMELQARQCRVASLMVLHDLVYADRYCDRIVMLFGDGRYLAGARPEIMTESNLKALYGFPVLVREYENERIYLPARSGFQAQL